MPFLSPPRARLRALPSEVMLLVVVVATIASCGANGANGASAGLSTSAPSTSTTSLPVVVTTAPAPAPSSTAAVPAASFPNPGAAAQAIFRVWTAGDRAAAGALALAPAGELDKLFAHKALPAAKLRTCDDGAFGPATCFFGNGQGGVSLTLTKAGTGWSVINIDAYCPRGRQADLSGGTARRVPRSRQPSPRNRR